MKKLVLIFPLVALLAVGCSSSTESVSQQTKTNVSKTELAPADAQNKPLVNSQKQPKFNCQDLISESQISAETKSSLNYISSDPSLGCMLSPEIKDGQLVSPGSVYSVLIQVEPLKDPETQLKINSALTGGNKTEVKNVGSQALLSIGHEEPSGNQATLSVISSNKKYSFTISINVDNRSGNTKGAKPQDAKTQDLPILEGMAKIIDVSLNKY